MVGGFGAGLAEWYLALASCWLDAEPPLRRRLILEAHDWIAERVFEPGPGAWRRALDELGPGGALERRLLALIPPVEMETWGGWPARVAIELRRALARPPAQRNEAWAHSLFLIPYGLRVTRITRKATGRRIDPPEPLACARATET
ncbi:MAG TPA: hypothetical protein VJX92_07690 [Methylomirabilota bacterium]|nr:hypothetical protein [Methylomirabilota bacterium]